MIIDFVGLVIVDVCLKIMCVFDLNGVKRRGVVNLSGEGIVFIKMFGYRLCMFIIMGICRGCVKFMMVL